MNLLAVRPYLSKEEFIAALATHLPYVSMESATWQSSHMYLEVEHDRMWSTSIGWINQQEITAFPIDLPAGWQTGMHDHKWCLLFLKQYPKKYLKALRKTYAMYLEQQNARSSHEGLEAALADVPFIEDDLTDIPY